MFLATHCSALQVKATFLTSPGMLLAPPAGPPTQPYSHFQMLQGNKNSGGSQAGLPVNILSLNPQKPCTGRGAVVPVYPRETKCLRGQVW